MGVLVLVVDQPVIDDALPIQPEASVRVDVVETEVWPRRRYPDLSPRLPASLGKHSPKAPRRHRTLHPALPVGELDVSPDSLVRAEEVCEPLLHRNASVIIADGRIEPRTAEQVAARELQEVRVEVTHRAVDVERDYRLDFATTVCAQHR